MNRIDSSLISTAIVELKRHSQKNNKEKYCNISNTHIFIPDIPIHVQLSLSEVPRHPHSRPIRIDIPHPLYRLPNLCKTQSKITDNYEEQVSVCIIVKDTSKKWIKELIDLYPKQLHYIKKVLSISSLRKKYVTYSNRRELLCQFDMFLADDRILPMLGKLLGKNFFKVKKHPVPIKITRKEALPLAVERCLRATYMFINPGTCITIRAGNTGMPNDIIRANILAIITNAVAKLPRKWDILSSILVKTPHSVSLPVYSRIKTNHDEIINMMKDETSNLLSKKNSSIVDECKDLEHQFCKERNIFKKPKLSSKSPLLRALIKSGKDQEKFLAF